MTTATDQPGFFCASCGGRLSAADDPAPSDRIVISHLGYVHQGCMPLPRP